ncbi:ABC transporter permease [Nocardioides antri]|uniref:ABC transporter permease n=1 Tax=Nocardioides antri TaxID=2607659 RepID=A0A5B1M3P8_9ACTN|nr:ABC transporter permease [Nocardioides antri]KAA1427835.1 ABC transporter permease [Nocardioides antri]
MTTHATTEPEAVEPTSALASAPTVTARAERRWSSYVEALALPAVTVVIAAFFSLWPETSDYFLTSANLTVLLGSQTVVAVIALGALVPLIAGQWDLSVGAVAALAAVLTAQALADGVALALALALGIGAGVLIGVVNAFITTRVGVNAVITTLGMATILDGVINQRTGGIAVFGDIPLAVVEFGTGTFLGLPRTVYAVAVVALLVYYLLDHTPYGRYLYALGVNPSAAALVGIRVRLVLSVSFVLAGALAATGGLLQLARAGGADPNVGAGFALPALAAAFLSAASIRPGRYNVGGTLVAILFLAVLNNGLNLAGTPPYTSSYVNGAALILGVALAAWLGRRNSSA